MGCTVEQTSAIMGAAPSIDDEVVRKGKNQQMKGFGGEIIQRGEGRIVCLVCAFDYEDYGALESAGCGPLSCTPDGLRFAGLARACGAEVTEFYDKQVGSSQGFPDRDLIINWIQRTASTLGPDDTFIWFYAGHGNGAEDLDGDEDDGQDEELCFVTQEGQYNPIKDDEIGDLLYSAFNPETHILVVTDCCHSATVCDLSDGKFGSRPVAHLAAVKDEQVAQDLGDGGAFTSSLLETIESLVADGNNCFTLTEIFNHTHDDFSNRFAEQDFCFERSPDLDPDTFNWPLVPPEGWSCQTLLDQQW